MTKQNELLAAAGALEEFARSWFSGCKLSAKEDAQIIYEGLLLDAKSYRKQAARASATSEEGAEPVAFRMKNSVGLVWVEGQRENCKTLADFQAFHTECEITSLYTHPSPSDDARDAENALRSLLTCVEEEKWPHKSEHLAPLAEARRVRAKLNAALSAAKEQG